MQDIKNRIDKLKTKSQTSVSSRCENLLLEILSGILTGGFLGYWIDSIFGTLPLMLFICTILGLSGAMLNIYRK